MTRPNRRQYDEAEAVDALGDLVQRDHRSDQTFIRLDLDVDDNRETLPELWRTATGEHVRIDAMETSHLVNTLRLLYRKPELLVHRDYVSALSFEAYSWEKDWGPCHVPDGLEDLEFGSLGIRSKVERGDITVPEATAQLERLVDERRKYTLAHTVTRALQAELGRRVMVGRTNAFDSPELDSIPTPEDDHAHS